MALDLNELRIRINNGEPYTREELKESLACLRTVRTEAATKTQTKRAAKAPMSDEDLNASLANLGLDL